MHVKAVTLIVGIAVAVWHALVWYETQIHHKPCRTNSIARRWVGRYLTALIAGASIILVLGIVGICVTFVPFLRPAKPFYPLGLFPSIFAVCGSTIGLPYIAALESNYQSCNGDGKSMGAQFCYAAIAVGILEIARATIFTAITHATH